MIDLRNALSLAAVLECAMTAEDGSKTPPQLMINMDMTSVGLHVDAEAVLVSDKVRAELKAHRRGEGTTNDEKVNRWVHFLPGISAAGKLVFAVFIVYDRNFKSSQLRPVSETDCTFSYLGAARKKERVMAVVQPPWRSTQS